MLGHQRPASETPFKWRSAAGPMMARLYWYLDHLSHDQRKKYVVKVGPPLKNFLDPRMGNDVRLFTLSLHRGIHPHFRHLKI